MVQSQLHHRDIRDPYVLESFGRVPRHRFVSAGLQSQACNDQPLPIGSEADDLPAARGRLHAAGLATTVGGPGAGAGCCMRLSDRPSGTAVAEVHAIELVPELAAQADATLRELRCKGIRGVAGNGLSGAPERAPFDAIIGSAAAPHVPEDLLQQLAPGGRMILPVGDLQQFFIIVMRSPSGYRQGPLLPVRFVPMRSHYGAATISQLHRRSRSSPRPCRR